MLPQIVNIVAGFVLASPKLKAFGAKELIEKGEALFHPYRHGVGWVSLVVGLVALFERIGIVPLHILDGSSYPQAVPAILIGCILLSDFFKSYPHVHKLIRKIEPYKLWIGLCGITAGLVSMLFGCVVC